MNSLPQFMMMCYENLETLSVLSETPDHFKLSAITEPIKWCLLAFLTDSEEFASTSSDLRGYDTG